jgi:hypothetical protein
MPGWFEHLPSIAVRMPLSASELSAPVDPEISQRVFRPTDWTGQAARIIGFRLTEFAGGEAIVEFKPGPQTTAVNVGARCVRHSANKIARCYQCCYHCGSKEAAWISVGFLMNLKPSATASTR